MLEASGFHFHIHLCICRAVTVSTAYRGTSTFEFEPIKGRYVNIVLPGNSEMLTLCEVEVFAGKGLRERERNNNISYLCTYSYVNNFVCY